MNIRKFSICIPVIATVAVLVSCGGPPKPKEEPAAPSEPVAVVFEPQTQPKQPVEPEQPPRQLPQRPAGVYELVWVDPRIVAADTLMQLIAADRIDSIEVSLKERSTYQTPSISFRVTSTNCPAKINLTDNRGTLLMHLFNSELSPGYYKLTLSPSSRSSRLAAGNYFLKAEYCGQSKRVAVKLD